MKTEKEILIEKLEKTKASLYKIGGFLNNLELINGSKIKACDCDIMVAGLENERILAKICREQIWAVIDEIEK